ncbi:large conductance mechanosensitive channel protein MscL [Actinomadura craniellae]|uniref:Large conductance mechanosensitive channel protein MscL n=1 Tax=Actinomadura craniellae TaxID=2231787 RepID=A0A365HB05_9ACTN|nr:large conductance mechanosensitive channel protein MscL [Actinomadura craniellae]RAY15443.1 large conductance mechanosensitive channel protein MscL [Actinomadura craniellae]
MGGFRTFLIRGNLVDLAVAFVVGAAFASLVKDFATSFIAPLLALFGGKQDFTRLAFTINDTRFPYGVFLTSAVAFFITAVIVYFLVVLPTSKLLERLDRGQQETERECPQCLSEIPLEARRCRFCTSEVVPVSEAPAPDPAS